MRTRGGILHGQHHRRAGPRLRRRQHRLRRLRPAQPHVHLPGPAHVLRLRRRRGDHRGGLRPRRGPPHARTDPRRRRSRARCCSVPAGRSRVDARRSRSSRSPPAISPPSSRSPASPSASGSAAGPTRSTSISTAAPAGCDLVLVNAARAHPARRRRGAPPCPCSTPWRDPPLSRRSGSPGPVSRQTGDVLRRLGRPEASPASPRQVRRREQHSGHPHSRPRTDVETAPPVSPGRPPFLQLMPEPQHPRGPRGNVLGLFLGTDDMGEAPQRITCRTQGGHP